MQRKNGRRKKIAYVLCGILAVVLFSGCQSTAADGTDEKVFIYGDTTFNAENDESDVNPHNGYSGWACIRYGIGETLFHYSDSMEIEPWLAESYEIVDDTTWRITLHEGISFTSGRTLDAEAVKECLEDLIAVHDRARGDLKIESIKADGLIVTIHTEQPVPALLNYLSDPYGCIIDMQAGVTDDGNVAGTGPYRAVQVETDQGLTLVKNDNYWNGTPKLDRIEVKTIRDGDTMTMALQSGELDAAYGLPYSNLILFRDERRGIGTDVVYEKVEEQMEGVISFTEEMKKHHIEMQTTYCKMELISPGETVARSLQIPLTEPCYCLKRVRNAVGKPMVYTITYLKKICELPTEPEPYMESLYQYLREEHGIYIESGRDTLEAALPSEEVQKALKIDAQMPIFIRTRQTFRKGGEVFEYSICYYPGNRYKYTVEL